ncbi:hypothetical protein [Saccharopolyspora shandongensis]|uniref:WXG100-like domain-containing protein n=1 Tax=Saccharopolyspora shandongensis TaxID=418495 RepID=UPI0033C66528
MAETEVSPDVQRLLEVLVGSDWPEGDPDELRAMAANWRSVTERLNNVIDYVNRGAVQVDRALAGQTAESFRSFIKPFLGEDGYLPQLSLAAAGLADALETMAVQIETLRIIIIELLVLLAIDIAALIAAAIATFGASTAMIPGEMAVTRVSIQAMIRKTISELLAHLAGSVLDQVGVTFLAQFVEICKGKQKGFNGAMLKTAAQNGAVGGAVGIGAGALGNFLKIGGAKALNGKVPGAKLFDGSPATTWKGAGAKFGANMPLHAGWGAGVGAAEAAAQDAASGSTGDEVYGAENGAFAGTMDAGRGAFNPHGKFSTSSSVYVDKLLNLPWRNKNGGPASPTPIQTEIGPPKLPEIQKEDWNAWTDETLGALHA